MTRLVYRHTPETFWSLVDRRGPDECWPFTRTAGAVRGYGRISYHCELWLAHRLAYVLTSGPIREGMHVLHHCDNPPCCNPSHLYEGTDQDNSRDRERRHRGGANAASRRGEQHFRSKLTEDGVRRIRTLRLEGWSYSQLAAELGVTIASVLKGKTWGWVH